MRNQIGADLGAIINMGALAVSQLLDDAESKGLELTLDTAAVENQVRFIDVLVVASSTLKISGLVGSC